MQINNLRWKELKEIELFENLTVCKQMNDV